MKKYLLPIILFLLFIPLVVKAKTCDISKITIESIELDDKSEDVEIQSEATASGRNINVALTMSELGDYADYNLVVKNESDEDYELDESSFNISSEYINYSLSTEDNSNIVKANTSKTVTLRIEYKNIVPNDVFENRVYSVNKTMTFNLLNDQKEMVNPLTKNGLLIFVVSAILFLSISLFLLLNKTKTTRYIVLLIGTLSIIPITAYALCKCEITIESNVTIEQSNFFCLVHEKSAGDITEYNEFTKGESIKDYYLNIIENIDDYDEYTAEKYSYYSSTYDLYHNGEYITEFYTTSDGSYRLSFYPNAFRGIDDDSPYLINYEDPIMGSNKGCYYIKWGV